MENIQWTKETFIQVFNNTYSPSLEVVNEAHQHLYRLQNSSSFDFSLFMEVIQSPELDLPIKIASMKNIFFKIQQQINNSIKSIFPNKEQKIILNKLELDLLSIFNSLNGNKEMKILRDSICRVLCLCEIVKIKNHDLCFLDKKISNINELPPNFFDFFFEFSSLFEGNYFDRKIKLHINSKLREKKDLLLLLFQQAIEYFLNSPSESLLNRILQFLESLCSLKTDLMGNIQLIVFLYSLGFISATSNNQKLLSFIVDNLIQDLGELSVYFKSICMKMSSLLTSLPLPDDLLQNLLSYLQNIFTFSEFSSEMLSSNAHSFFSSLIPSLNQILLSSSLSTSLFSLHLYLSLQHTLTLIQKSFDPVNMLSIFVENFPYILYFRNRISKFFFKNLDSLIESLAKDDFSEFTTLFESLSISFKENKESFAIIANNLQSIHSISPQLIANDKVVLPSFDTSHESFLLFDNSCFTDFCPFLPNSITNTNSLDITPLILPIMKHFQIKMIFKSKVSTPEQLNAVLSQVKKDKESITTGDESEIDSLDLNENQDKAINESLLRYSQSPSVLINIQENCIQICNPTFNVTDLIQFRKELNELSNFISRIIETFEGSVIPFVHWIFSSALEHNLALVNNNKLTQDEFIVIFESCLLFLKHIFFRFEEQDLAELMNPFCSKIFESCLGLISNPLILLSSIDFLHVFFSEIHLYPGLPVPLNILKVLYHGFESQTLIIRSIRAFNAGIDVLNKSMMSNHLESFSQFSNILINILQVRIENELDSNKSYSLIPLRILINFFGNILKFFLNLFSLVQNDTVFKVLFEFCKKILSITSSINIIINFQVLFFNEIIRFIPLIPPNAVNLLSSFESLKDEFLIKYLQSILTLLNQHGFRKGVLILLEELVQSISIKNSKDVISVLEFYKEALSKGINSNSDLFESFADFFINKKENKAVQEWLASSFQVFCTNIIHNVSKNSLLPPLKFLLSIFLDPQSGPMFLKYQFSISFNC
jgi:hypothetical protein